MHCLLDTHILIWMFTDDSRLSANARKIIEDENNTLLYSDVSLWEVALKHQSHPRGNIDGERFSFFCESSDLHSLAINKKHILHVQNLPLIHHDPFDRLLISQSVCEDVYLISHDGNISKYDLPTIIHV